MPDEVAVLKLELLGLKAELQTLVHYLRTVRVQAGVPVLGPDHWHQ